MLAGLWLQNHSGLTNIFFFLFVLSGAVATASLGDCSARLSEEQESNRLNAFRLCAQRDKVGLFADLFASVSCTAQHGNFQRLFLDLTRLSARFDFPSGSQFLSGATRLAQDVYYSRRPDLRAIQAVCPDMLVSLQQQVIILFSWHQ